jgi:hypothetical protein
MTKIIIPFFAFACVLSGVSAQTTKDGDLRECTGRGWNTCDSWKHCNWRGTKSDGECYNNCPVIGFPDNVGTTRDCQNLEGCHMVGYSTTCDFKSKVVDCSAANNPNWLTTWHQCQAIDGCMFNPIFGKNECIEIAAWSPEAYVNVQNHPDGGNDQGRLSDEFNKKLPIKNVYLSSSSNSSEGSSSRSGNGLCSSANNPNWLITLQQCAVINGCMFNPIPGRNECIKEVNCSAANNSDWVITWRQCQQIDGCMFNPIFGKNECIRDWSAAAYVNIQNDRDGDEDEDTQSESSGDVSSEDNDLPSHDSNSTYTSADSDSDSDSDSGGYSNSNDMGNSASSNDRDGGRKSYLRQSRL